MTASPLHDVTPEEEESRESSSAMHVTPQVEEEAKTPAPVESNSAAEVAAPPQELEAVEFKSPQRRLQELDPPCNLICSRMDSLRLQEFSQHFAQRRKQYMEQKQQQLKEKIKTCKVGNDQNGQGRCSCSTEQKGPT